MKRLAIALLLSLLAAGGGRLTDPNLRAHSPAGLQVPQPINGAPETAARQGWGWMDAWVWPEAFESPQEPITVAYSTSGLCEMEDYVTWLLGVEMTGSDGSSGIWYDYAGSWVDTAWKPRSDVTYTIRAYYTCGDLWEPYYQYVWIVSQEAKSAAVLRLAQVQYVGDSVSSLFFPLPGQTCPLTNEQDGFSYEWWIQIFRALDQWGFPYEEPFWVCEDYLDVQPWDLCDYEEYSDDWQLAYMQFYDDHQAPHPQCCSECSCLSLMHNHWLGNPPYGIENLVEMNWLQSCFGHAITYMSLKSY